MPMFQMVDDFDFYCFPTMMVGLLVVPLISTSLPTQKNDADFIPFLCTWFQICLYKFTYAHYQKQTGSPRNHSELFERIVYSFWIFLFKLLNSKFRFFGCDWSMRNLWIIFIILHILIVYWWIGGFQFLYHPMRKK